MMEPLLISENSVHRRELIDLAMELVAKSAGFKRSLPSAIQASRATLVRVMNCYYNDVKIAAFASRWMPGLFPA